MSEQLSPHHEHKKPRERIEEMHSAFDAELENILEELQVWDFRLATAYAEDQLTGEQSHRELAMYAKNELDEAWSYYADWIMVSGVWDSNRPVLSERGILNNVSHDEPIFGPALSNGFEVDIREDAAPVIGLSFKIGTMAASNKHLYGNIEGLAFARPEKATFSFARKSAEFEAPKDQLINAVHYYDGLLKLYTHEPSDFYRKSAHLQQQFFEKIINDLSDTITAPAYVTQFHYAEVPYIYRRGTEYMDDNSLPLEYIDGGSANILLSGTIKGVTILDSLYASDNPIRSKDDLIDADAGICLIVSLSEGSLSKEQVDDRDLIVPARLIKELDITIS